MVHASGIQVEERLLRAVAHHGLQLHLLEERLPMTGEIQRSVVPDVQLELA